MVIVILIRVINVLFGLLELALVLRIVLTWLKMSPGHPVMRFLFIVTEPILRLVRQSLRKNFKPWEDKPLVMAPLATLLILFLVQAILVRVLGFALNPWLFRPLDDLGLWLSRVLSLLLQLYYLAILLRVLLAWFGVSYARPVMRFLWDITEPLLAPIRRRVTTFAGLDFTPVVAVLILVVVEVLLSSLLQAIF